MSGMVVVPLCALILSCEGQHIDLPKDQIWTSEHFRYAARAGDQAVCSGVVDQLELHLQAIHGYLGLTWPGTVVNYYKFLDQDDFHANSGCPGAAIACAKPTPDVRSSRALNGHELIHVYTGVLGHPPAFFEEGLAEALAPEGRTFTAPEQSWRDILAAPRLADGTWPDVDYSGGGWFMTFLLRKFGPAPLLALYQAAALNASTAALAASFLTVYGQNFDDVWTQAQATSPILAGLPIWECASAQPVLMGSAASPLVEACDGRGAFAGLDLAGPTTLSWSSDSKLDFSLSSCAPDQALVVQLWDYWYEPGALAVSAGKYYAATHSPTSPIAFREMNGVLGTDCASLTPMVLPTDVLNILVVSIANSDGPWFVLPRLAKGDSFSFRTLASPNTSGVAATVEACDTCQGPCRGIAADSDSQMSTGMVLRFTDLTAFEGITMIRLLYQWPSGP